MSRHDLLWIAHGRQIHPRVPAQEQIKIELKMVKKFGRGTVATTRQGGSYPSFIVVKHRREVRTSLLPMLAAELRGVKDRRIQLGIVLDVRILLAEDFLAVEEKIHPRSYPADGEFA